LGKERFVQITEIEVEVIDSIVVSLAFLGGQYMADVLHSFGSYFAIYGSQRSALDGGNLTRISIT
jgi:hypothetical protein